MKYCLSMGNNVYIYCKFYFTATTASVPSVMCCVSFTKRYDNFDKQQSAMVVELKNMLRQNLFSFRTALPYYSAGDSSLQLTLLFLPFSFPQCIYIYTHTRICKCVAWINIQNMSEDGCQCDHPLDIMLNKIIKCTAPARRNACLPFDIEKKTKETIRTILLVHIEYLWKTLRFSRNFTPVTH